MTTQQSHLQAWQTCLSDDVVLAFQRGEATAQELQHIHEHVDRCDSCRGLVMLTAGMAEATGDSTVESSSRRLTAFVNGAFPGTSFAAGKRLAQRFDILRFVQRGGMGEVYEAFDRVVGSRVALKTLLVSSADSAPALDRLCQEVNLARRVAHSNVCRIYDLHDHHEQGRHPVRFLAMEFVAGETLKDRLSAGELSIAEACAIGRQLLLGLGAIHAAGVLHLDFKSQNVMLRSGAQPAQAVVMDFSLSRAFEKELHLRTSERHLAGSVGYMSPEQLECQATLGPASDVYAFGVVLFEMLTGHLPFEAESPTAIMLKQLQSRPPPPSSLRPGISAELDQFVRICLSRQPRARFATVEAALDELDGAIRVQSAGVSRRAPRWRRVLLAGALFAGLLASLAALVQAGRRPAEARVGLPLAAASPIAPAPTEQREQQPPPPKPGLSPAAPPAASPSSEAVPSEAVREKRARPLAARRQDHPAALSSPPTAAPPTPAREAAPTATSPSPAAPPEAQPEAKPSPWTPKRAPGFLL